jgi:hypothetical protein
MKVLPFDATLSAVTSPPRSRASDRDTLRPSPVPGAHSGAEIDSSDVPDGNQDVGLRRR